MKLEMSVERGLYTIKNHLFCCDTDLRRLYLSYSEYRTYMDIKQGALQQMQPCCTVILRQTARHQTARFAKSHDFLGNEYASTTTFDDI